MTELVDRRVSAWPAGVFRAPVILFRLRMGWLFFGRLLLLTHVGRRTGRERQTVLEVVSHDTDPPVWYVAAAWGDRSDWYRNVKKNPHARISVGREHYEVSAAPVDFDVSVRIHREYAHEHPLAARFVGRMLGIDLVRSDPRVLAERIPLVALLAEADTEVDPVASVRTTGDETRATYDRIAPIYEIVEGFWERRARAVGLAALAPRRGEWVIDIGCGPGHAICEMGNVVGSEGRAIGVDLSSEMCALARRRLERRNHCGTGNVVQADAVRLPFADRSFQAGFMSFTLELFDTPVIPTVLAECRRILRPGGRLAVVALNKRHPAPLMQQVYEWGHERFPNVLDCRPIHLEASLAEAGFTVGVVRHLSLWGLPVDVAVGEIPMRASAGQSGGSAEIACPPASGSRETLSSR